MAMCEDVIFSDCLRRTDGYLTCEDVRVTDVRRGVESALRGLSDGISATPFYLYSKAQILNNARQYTSALDRLDKPYILGYAMKANPNFEILSILRSHNPSVSATLVSGYELLLALKAGFKPENLLLNGNGKKIWEIKLAAEHGCLLNVDSEFGLRHTIQVSRGLTKPLRILLRINPDIDPDVHPYISTGMGETKFGVEANQIRSFLEQLRFEPNIQLVGLHCHLGSTIDSTRVFRECVEKMLQLVHLVKEAGFNDIQYLNIGGGLGINYTQHAHRTLVEKAKLPTIDAVKLEEIYTTAENKLMQYPHIAKQLGELIKDFVGKTICLPEFTQKVHTLLVDFPKLLKAFNHVLTEEYQMLISMPTPDDLIASIHGLVQDQDLTLILEPGRSVVGNAGILVTEVIGCKRNGEKNFLVVDGAMTEVIRPSLYGAYHHIELAEPSLNQETRAFDIVGPVCESGDFLAKDRVLTTPHEGCTLAVFDTGSYCSSMGSNYNMRTRPAEVLVDKSTWTIIRFPETFEDLAKLAGAI